MKKTNWWDADNGKHDQQTDTGNDQTDNTTYRTEIPTETKTSSPRCLENNKAHNHS
jgi:hypothetical protein